MAISPVSPGWWAGHARCRRLIPRKERRLELETFVIEHLYILFQAPVEWKADFPRPRKDPGVLDGGFVADVVRIHRREALYHTQLVGVVVSRRVKPRLVVEVF